MQDAQAIIKLQREVEEKELALKGANPEFFAQVKAIEDAKKNIDTMWEALKEKLLKENDLDVHEVVSGNTKCRFSLSKTSKIGVVDIDKVPEEFVETKKVADPLKLKQYYELYGEVPEGCEDKSFYRLNKKITVENTLGTGVVDAKED